MPARKDVPVLLSHGRSDPLLPFKQSERLRDLLAAAGLSVQWVPFADGHTIPAEVIKQLSQFVQGTLAR